MVCATRDVFGHIVGVEFPLHAGQRHQAVQGAAVEQVPADARGDAPADGAFAGAGGSVDGDDGYRRF